ncbi:MAG TPA: DUF1036 domain-containing protein, partial [Roseiarcus sp.]|nr:DUF1036 domain-containing protein [Roseiarcus sp.]
QVVNDYYGFDFYLQNNCTHPVSFALNYKTNSGAWKATGYWSANPNKGFYLTDDDGRLHSTNFVYYLYAEATDDSGKIWSGNSTNTEDITKVVEEIIGD